MHFAMYDFEVWSTQQTRTLKDVRLHIPICTDDCVVVEARCSQNLGGFSEQMETRGVHKVFRLVVSKEVRRQNHNGAQTP